MGMRRGTLYEYGDITFSGYIDDDTQEIVELYASFECPGYWGNNVKTYIYPQDDGLWFIECGANNQMADYMSNSWETWHRDFDYETIDDAIEACLEWVQIQQSK